MEVGPGHLGVRLHLLGVESIPPIMAVSSSLVENELPMPLQTVAKKFMKWNYN